MAFSFNMDEILAMAEKIEINGAAFYRKAADNVSDSSQKDMLIELAEMEDDHQKTFAALRKELSDTEKSPTVFDPEDEAAAYLNALADVRVFYEKEIDVTSMKEILKEAIVAEKDSIVFYLGMKELVPEKLGKDKIDKVIKEEMAHIRTLSSKLKAL